MLTHWVSSRKATAPFFPSAKKAEAQRSQLVSFAGVVLAATGIFFRSGFRTLMIDSGLHFLPVREAWLVLPTIIVFATVARVIALDRKTLTSEPAT